MDLWMIFFTSLIMGFSGAIMPGPFLTVTINESLRRGARVGPQLVTGHALLELALVIAIFGGIGTYINLPAIKGTIGIVGGLFLFWMAYGILKECILSSEIDLSTSVTNKGLNPLVAGITVTTSNPYWFIWWATAGAGSLILASNNGIFGISAFYIGHVLSDYIWYIFIAYIVARGKRFFNPFIYRSILGICGLFLVGLAGYFIYSGVSFLAL